MIRPGSAASSDDPEGLLQRSGLILSLLLFLGTILLYLPALQNGFVSYDDPAYVLSNSHVLQGLSWSNIKWVWTATIEANWHPLTWVSHMLDVQLFGLNPRGHHFVNVLLHALNVALLFQLFRKATGSLSRSAIVAALFAVHPLNVECVAWIAERKSLLSMLFLLLAFLAYEAYVRRRGFIRYAVVFVLFALGLSAKPMVITLPVLLLLWDYWPLARTSASQSESSRPWTIMLVAEKIPLFILSGASAWITLYAQHKGGALGSTSVLPLSQRLENAIFSYVAYVGKLIWPTRLAVFYPHPEGSLAVWKVLLSAVVLVAVTALAWRSRNARPWLLTGWLWYLVAMVPMIGAVQVGRQAMADRYAYLPFIGLFIISVWGGAELLAALKFQRLPKMVATGAVLLIYASITFLQIGYWHDSYALFSHAVAVTNRNGLAEGNLGAALVSMGRPDLALSHLEAAEQFAPQLSTPHYDLGVLNQQQGHLEAARQQYELALKYSADPTEIVQTHNNLGFVLLNLNELQSAKNEFTAALQIVPDKQNSLLGRGMVEFQEGKMDAAVTDLTRASQISPSAMAQFWLGRTYEAEHNWGAATLAYQAALQIAPGMAEAMQGLQRVLDPPIPTSKHDPKPTELLIKRFERLVLRGALLSPDGWKSASELFTSADPYPADSEIQVEWTGTTVLGEEWNTGTRAQVNTKWNDYYGTIDSNLIFKPQTIGMEEMYTLVWVPSPSASSLHGNPASGTWKIDERLRNRAADIPYAIKYLEMMRVQSNDPVRRKNAAESILALKRAHLGCGVPNPC